MAGHRRAALLKLTWVFAATGVAASDVLMPIASNAIVPGPGDIGVGWCFLVGSLLALRRLEVAGCLGLAGVLWVLVGLAPLGPDAIEEPVARLALVPTALLACAAGCLSSVRAGRLVVAAGALALMMAAVGGAGAPRFAQLGLALAAVIVPTASPGWRTGARAVQFGLGGGLVVVGLDVAGVLALPAELSVALHLFVLAGGAIAVGWWVATGVRLGAGLTLNGPLELGRALGQVLGTGEVAVEFPRDGGGWLDPAGRPTQSAAASYDVTDGAGRVLARTRSVLVVAPDLVPDLHRFLRAAGDGSRLRALLRDRAEELACSKGRLVSAADDERRRLVWRLEVGPLRRLERLSHNLGTRVDGPEWTARIAEARRTLDVLVGGLDPVDTAGGLVAALARLAEASGAAMVVSGAVPAGLNPSAARTVWFVCAEALANGRKHAAGASLSVALDASDDLLLTVTDDGPGGADPGGAGLGGLANRLALIGGSLDVVTGATGTTLVACVPAREVALPLTPRPVGLAAVNR